VKRFQGGTSMSMPRLSVVSLILAALACFGLAPGSAAPQRLVSRSLPALSPEKPVSVGDTLSTKAGQRRRLLLPDRTVVFLQQGSTLHVKGAGRVNLSAGEAFFETSQGKLAPALVVQTPKREVRATASRFGVRIDDAGTTVLVATGRVSVGGIETPLLAGQVLESKSDKPSARRISHRVEWTRDLRQAAPLVPASTHAGGSLIARDPLLARTQIELVRSLLGAAGRDDTFTLVTAATRTNKLQTKPAANESVAVREAIAAC
jgi:hypothetical protein